MKAKVLLAVLGLGVLLSGTAARADGLIVVSPGPGGPAAGITPLEVRFHKVEVRITDQVAVTEVDQVFYNPSGARLEGHYLFPIPKEAQIDAFAMDVDGRMTEAELLDADRARGIYEEIVRKARDPALLEYAGQGLFRVRIFPIEPRSEKRVRLKYTEVLRAEAGLVRYRYPLNTEKFSAAPLRQVSVTVHLETTRDLATLYSPSHPVEVRRRGARAGTVGWEETDSRPDTDFELLYGFAKDDGLGMQLLTYNDGDPEGGYFLLLAAPPEGGTVREQPKDVVFVLDTSGSMAEGEKLAQATRALGFCLKNLAAADRFQIVRFSTDVEPLFDGLARADATHLERAEEFLAGLRPRGGTAIEEALATAVGAGRDGAGEGRPFVVVFLTDGLPTVGGTDERQILGRVRAAAGERALRVFPFGVGTDVNTRLLDGLAEQTRGASQYVLPHEDLELKVSAFYAKISHPVLADLALAFTGGVRGTKIHPHPLPDLFRGEQLVVLGRYGGKGSGAVTLTGRAAGRARSFTEEFAFPARDERRAFIPRLWATRRVGFLLDEIRLRGESAELRDEVVALARRHGIVTPYTAYLIVEDEARRNVPAARQTMAPAVREESFRRDAGRQFDRAMKEKSGGAAVDGAIGLSALKSAERAQPAAAAPAAFAGAQSGADADEAKRVARAVQSQQQRFAGGRAFYQQGAAWVDARLLGGHEAARKTQVRFGSADYFALLEKHPEAAPWLALGRQVQFQIGETVYEVVE
jgi:Ca-activated chloride channel family protein